MSGGETTPSKTQGRRRVQRGVVKSDKRDKTISVTVSWKTKHPLYGKYIRQRTVLQAHDADNTAREGDIVEVQETRPLSKTKRWRLVQVLERAKLSTAERSAADESAKDSETQETTA